MGKCPAGTFLATAVARCGEAIKAVAEGGGDLGAALDDADRRAGPRRAWCPGARRADARGTRYN